MRSKCYKSDVGIVGEQIDALLQRILELVQLLIIHASVDDEEEYRRCRGPMWQLILQSSVLRYQLRGQIILRYSVRVVWREVVPCQTEGHVHSFDVKSTWHHGLRIAPQFEFLHRIGSYCTAGMELLMFFSGEYRQLMGTTMRVASSLDEGHMFHAMRTPSLSSAA